VAYRAHIGDNYYVSVTSGFDCVDIRHFYVPYGLPDKCSDILNSASSCGSNSCGSFRKWCRKATTTDTYYILSRKQA